MIRARAAQRHGEFVNAGPGERIRVRWVLLFLLISIGATYAMGRRLANPDQLRVVYGPNGVEQVAYNGVVLEDVRQFPSDGFHIWHMKVTDLAGSVLPQDGWGETNLGRRWDSADHTWTYMFPWGTIAARYSESGDDLNIEVVEVNKADSGVVVQGASIYPLALHLPALPAGFGAGTYPHISNNVDAPGVVEADYGSAMVTTLVTDARHALYTGFVPAGPSDAYATLVSSTTPDGTATFLPHYSRPVAPGKREHFALTVRFSRSGLSAATVAMDAYANWTKTWPATLDWTDRRMIGTAYLASSPDGPLVASGYPNNPRRYFNDSLPSDFDVRTATGLAHFQRRILEQADQIVQNLRQLNAQGVITWDIEGEQYPQPTSYVCSPDQVARVAPEMESTVTDPSSPYVGSKLDDAYFATIRSAGFRVGVCIRPQQFVLMPDGTASQKFLPPMTVAGELVRKMQYAHDRWGVTLFYLDSTVTAEGGTLDPETFRLASAALPDSLLIPEEYTAQEYAYTAPLKSFLFHAETGTDPMVRALYRKGFSAVLVNDVDPLKLAAVQPALTRSVRLGDLLMVHADYWQANNSTALQIYHEAMTVSP